MTILDLLETTDARVTLGNRWMVWDSINDIFIVYSCKPYQKKTRVVRETAYESEAVNALMEEL